MAIGTEQESFGLLFYLRIARKRWGWIVLPLLVAAALAAWYSLSQPDWYRAESRVLLAETASQRTLDPSSQNAGFLNREMSNEVSLARSDIVEGLVAEALGELPDVDIASATEADVLTFTATADSADAAALYANTWAEMFIKVKQDSAVRNITAAADGLQRRLQDLRVQRQELRAPLDQLDERINGTADPDAAAALQRDYDRLADDLRYELELVTSQAESALASLTQLELQSELSAVGEARVVRAAMPPDEAGNAPLGRDIALGAFVGLIAGFGLALLIDAFDNTIKSARDVEEATDLPVLASIPRAGKSQRQGLGMITHVDPKGVFASRFHAVRSSLEFLSFENDVKSVLITSANPSEGKSTTASNLALALASVDNQTVLVDIDFRRATIHKIYNIPEAPGLSDFVLGHAEPREIAHSARQLGIGDLTVLPAGTTPASPTAFVGTKGFLETVDWLESQADMVVIDAPPLLAVSDAQTLGRHVDAVLITARARKTTKAELQEVIAALRRVGANLLGVVVVAVDESDSEKYEYYRPQKPANRRNGTSRNGYGALTDERLEDIAIRTSSGR